MTKTIFRNTFTVGVSVLLLCTLLFSGLQYSQNRDAVWEELVSDMAYVQQGLAMEGEGFLKELTDTPSRITWIGADGEVLYDNAKTPATVSQKDYPEVEEALKEKEGSSIRKSDSHGTRQMYYAVRQKDGTVLRLSRPLSTVLGVLKQVSPVLWVFILVVLISGILSFRMAKQIVRPINDMNLDEPDKSVYPELTPLIERLQEQNLTIADQMEELKHRQKEFSTLTDNMNEGFLLIDANGVILSANRSVQVLIPDCEIGLTLNLEMSEEAQKAVEEAAEGKRAEACFSAVGRTWELLANPVISRSQVTGVVVLVMDVTEREQREQLRREFSANVSHELKSPLASISGYAELLAKGDLPKEQAQEFSNIIYMESQRMIHLVNDIVKLTRIDEDTVSFQWEEVNLYELAENAAESLQETAKRVQISLSLTGETAYVHGVRQLLTEMIDNLCENAIKYNHPGGEVRLEVRALESEVFLSVEDTGMGIPYEHQARVFERFYRVDKSHSRRMGGTGLGLSIVKHGASLHQARVDLKSEPGVGTRITLIFPKSELDQEEQETRPAAGREQ